MKEMYYGNTSIAQVYCGSTLVFRKGRTSEFFMRFKNTGTGVIVNTLNNLFSSSSGTPILLTATVERSGNITENVKGDGNTVNNFIVYSNESCVFRIKWKGGLFSLSGTTTNSYRTIVRSAGYEINIQEDIDIPANFMARLFRGCTN